MKRNLRKIEFGKNTYKEICDKAESISPVREGTAFSVDKRQKNMFSISPSYSLSFTRPFVYDHISKKYIETVWYNTFRKMVSEKPTWTSAELTTMLTSTQAQTLRYSGFIRKVTKGLYEPTNLMKDMVKEIETILIKNVEHDEEPFDPTEYHPTMTTTTTTDKTAAIPEDDVNIIVKDNNDYTKRILTWLDEHNLLWKAAGFSDNVLENMKNNDFIEFCKFVNKIL